MNEHKFMDEDVIKAFDILAKFEFFGGQRAGRELWFNKPTDIQNKDIGEFLRDLDFLKQFINRQKAEIDMLKGVATNTINTSIEFGLDKEGQIKKAKSEATKEFAEKAKRRLPIVSPSIFDQIVKELTEE